MAYWWITQKTSGCLQNNNENLDKQKFRSSHQPGTLICSQLTQYIVVNPLQSMSWWNIRGEKMVHLQLLEYIVSQWQWYHFINWSRPEWVIRSKYSAIILSMGKNEYCQGWNFLLAQLYLWRQGYIDNTFGILQQQVRDIRGAIPPSI